MNLLFLDTETTDNTPEARLVELAYIKSDAPMFEKSDLFKPPIPISIGAMAVHHITNKRVHNCPSFNDSFAKTELQKLLDSYVLVSHNAKYDMQVLKNEGINFNGPYICTLQVARHLLENIEGHGLQFLRYYFDLEVTLDSYAHSALGDTRVLRKLFYVLLDRMTGRSVNEPSSDEKEQEAINKMISLTQTPVLIKFIRFGKYEGQKFEDIASHDLGYLDWLYNSEIKKPQHERKEDLLFTLKHHLTS